MISMSQYCPPKLAKSKDWTPARQANAQRWCTAANRMIAIGEKEGIVFPKSPATGSQLSTSVGGFRESGCTPGAPLSKHKEGLAGDLFDGLNATGGAIGRWVISSMKDKNSALYKLAVELDLAFEHPEATVGDVSRWLHMQIGRPKSGDRIYRP